MSVNANNLPTIVDKGIALRVNKFIAELSNVYSANSLILYKELVKAVNGSEVGGFENQNWVSYLAYDVGFLDVFEVFEVPRSEIENIKALLNYNYNPSLKNLEIFLNIIFKDSSYTLTEGAGFINVNALDVPELNNLILIAGETVPNNILIDITTDKVLEYIAFDFLYNSQNLYILQNYVMAGVNLTITYTPFLNYIEIAKKNGKIDEWTEWLESNLDNLIKINKNKGKNGRPKN